jgi:hypothetical protein
MTTNNTEYQRAYRAAHRDEVKANRQRYLAKGKAPDPLGPRGEKRRWTEPECRATCHPQRTASTVELSLALDRTIQAITAHRHKCARKFSEG